MASFACQNKPRHKVRAAIVLPAVFIYLVCSAAHAGTVTLRLSNPADLDLRQWPVTVGVPFPHGELTTDTVSLTDSMGNVIPLQTRSLARWWARDNSISVLLVTFLADTASPVYTLHYGDGAPPPAVARDPLTVTNKDGAIIVNTGPMKVLIRQDNFRLLDQMWLDANGNGEFEDNEQLLAPSQEGGLFAGKFRAAHGATTLTVEEAGPLRSVVKASGRCRTPEGEEALTYTVRMTFHAGSPVVMVDCTLLQDTDECFLEIPAFGIELPLAGSEIATGKVTLEEGKEHPFTVARGQSASLTQIGPESREVIAGADKPGMKLLLERVKPYWSEKERALWERDERIKEYSWTFRAGEMSLEGKRAEGIIHVQPTGRPAGLAAGLRWFSGLHPKRMELRDGKLRILFWPQDDRVGPFRMHRGLAKTHSLCLVASPPGTSTDAVTLCRAFNQPPITFPSPEQFRHCRLWGDILPVTAGKFRQYERRARGLNRGQKGAAERLGGMLNFGDQTQGVGWWNNMETALDHGMFVQFARSAEREMFDSFEQAVNHFRDVDIYHLEANNRDTFIYMMPGYLPEAFLNTIVGDREKRRSVFWYDCQPAKGGVYRHGYRHRGNGAKTPYSLDSSRVPARGMCYSGSCGVGGHGWMVGLVDHYLLTGDRRSLDVAELVGEYMLKHHRLGIGRDNWININLVALYKATGNPAYRELVEKAVDFIYEQREEMANGTLKAGVMSPFYTILVYFRHLHELTGDDELARKFLECVDTMLKYEPTVECGAGTVWRRVQAYRDSRYHGDFADLAYAFELTGKRNYIDAGLNTFALYMQNAYHSTYAYEAPIFLSALDRLGINILNQPGEPMAGHTVYWKEHADGPAVITGFQNHAYRAPVQRSQKGCITVLSPSGKTVTKAPCTLGGYNTYRLEIPADSEVGTYKIEVRDPPALTSIAFLADRGEITNKPPATRVDGRYGPAMHLKDLAVMRLPREGNLRRSEGTVEIWFRPDWISPMPRDADLPYCYNVLFDSRNKRYTDGFYFATWDSGKKGTAKTLYGAWSHDRKATAWEHVRLNWPEPTWHHAGFCWKLTPDKAIGKVFLDGQVVGEYESAPELFPEMQHNEIIIGCNTTLSKNSGLNAVVDAVRISAKMAVPTNGMPEPTFDRDTLFLSDMSLCLWLAMDTVDDGAVINRHDIAARAVLHGAEPGPGARGQGMQFDGSSSHLALPIVRSPIPETPMWTAWVCPSRVSAREVVVTSGSYGHFMLHLDDGHPAITAFARWDGGKGFLTATAETALPISTWSHLAGGFDGRILKLFVNHQLAATAQLDGERVGIVRPPPQSGPDIRIGIGYVSYTDTSLSQPFAGMIDEVRLYCRSLSPEDLRRLEPPIAPPPAQR